MPESRFTWSLLFVGALLLGTAWILQSREFLEADAVAASSTAAPVVGYLAPDFTVETVSGESFTLSEYRGQPVVLNFWATWCPPCRAEIPFFQSASRKYNGQLVIAGIDDGEQRQTVLPFVSQMGMSYPVPLDQQSVVSRQYRVNSLPTTFFIDATGTIQYIHIGVLNQALLEAQIAQLLRS